MLSRKSDALELGIGGIRIFTNEGHLAVFTGENAFVRESYAEYIWSEVPKSRLTASNGADVDNPICRPNRRGDIFVKIMAGKLMAEFSAKDFSKCWSGK